MNADGAMVLRLVGARVAALVPDKPSAEWTGRDQAMTDALDMAVLKRETGIDGSSTPSSSPTR